MTKPQELHFGLKKLDIAEEYFLFLQKLNKNG